MIFLTPYPDRTWWHRGKPYSHLELIGDGVIHVVGLLVALGLGGILVASSGLEATFAVSVYVASLLLVLSISLAFNLAPVAPVKRLLARFDQAAIFLLIAGTYTPLLALLGDTPAATLLLLAVWSAALIGIALKLIVPQHFGRLALVLYLGIGWSGLLIFQSLASVLPTSTLLLIIAGGVAYCSGIIFHLWERLHFHNVIWHCFVVLGASIHLWAVLDCMVLKRL
jgi:hemolysin III